MCLFFEFHLNIIEFHEVQLVGFLSKKENELQLKIKLRDSRERYITYNIMKCFIF